MIDFRYHLVSLVSVFLALAIGIALGAGPLKGPIQEQLQVRVDQLRQDKDALSTQLETKKRAAENRDIFIASVQPALLAQQLTGQDIVLITLPGSNTDTIKNLVQAVESAGATVTGRVDLKEAWADPGKTEERAKLIRNLNALLAAERVAPPGTGGPAASPGAGSAAGAAPAPTQPPTGTSSVAPSPMPSAARPTLPLPSVGGATPQQEQLGSWLARGLLSGQPGQREPLDPLAGSVVDGFRKAGLIGITGELTALADEAVLLVPGAEGNADRAGTPSSSAGQDPNVGWTALAAGLDLRGQGTVMVGPASSAHTGGAVGAVRTGKDLAKQVSTVDTGGTPMGDLTTVLALHEQLLGRAGSYGFEGSVDGPMPARPTTGVAP